MPQKKTVRKPAAKTSRKTTAKRTSRRTSKKPKVYIPAYKAIILCFAIITVCMGLLLFTTLKEPDHKFSDAVIERYKEEIVDSKKKVDEEKKAEFSTASEPENKKADTKKTESTKKNVSSKKSEASEAASRKTESQKKDTPKQESPKKTERPKITESPQIKEEKPAEKNEISPAPAPAQKPGQKSKYNFPAARNGAQLIFVFDDGGQNLSHLSPFLKLPFPITVAVLPQITYSKETAALVRKSGNEVILHQPMQSINADKNPGPGAIKPDMTEEQIKSLLFQNINEIGPVAGMNNHEGSDITADAEKMAAVLQFASQEGIYFLDSRTNVETKVPYVAHELGYSWYERNIFLDNEKTKDNALRELKKGLDLANKNGNVIMIGHIWSADFLPDFLQDVYPELKAQGYTFSTVSKSKAKKY